ncbi:hypothetical protein DER29_1975 [Micromonospora sp. M71_S20]|nr:hypothetical protein DER29_1975 [Micromonospora sp. M71_S20]
MPADAASSRVRLGDAASTSGRSHLGRRAPPGGSVTVPGRRAGAAAGAGVPPGRRASRRPGGRTRPGSPPPRGASRWSRWRTGRAGPAGRVSLGSPSPPRAAPGSSPAGQGQGDRSTTSRDAHRAPPSGSRPLPGVPLTGASGPAGGCRRRTRDSTRGSRRSTACGRETPPAVRAVVPCASCPAVRRNSVIQATSGSSAPARALPPTPAASTPRRLRPPRTAPATSTAARTESSATSAYGAVTWAPPIRATARSGPAAPVRPAPAAARRAPVRRGRAHAHVPRREPP